jgi:hypothetical protein
MLVTGLGLAGCVSTPKPCLPANSAALFNGKDLTGWQAVSSQPGISREQVWSVRDGVIVCQGDPIGYLHTTEKFTNFRLFVEWRWAPGKPPGNSGVFLRVNGEPRALPRCLEAQLKSGDAGDLYGFHGMKINGEASRLKQVANHALGGDLTGVKKIFGNELKPGKWNRYEIEARGGQVTVWVNGLKVNEAADCEMVSGPVALQSEGGEVHFRNVYLQPLP